jgi:penicillin amidase
VNIRYTLAALALALSGCPAAAYLGYRFFPDPPASSGEETRTLPGLHAPGEIRVDRWGIPHIAAANEEDAFRLAGYAMARERLFQLDLLRHVSEGRLTELVGNPPGASPAPLEQDRVNRFLGFWRRAKETWPAVKDPARAELVAFAEGINAFAAEGKRPPELRILAHDFEPWEPADTLAAVNLFAYGISHNWTREAVPPADGAGARPRHGGAAVADGH